MSGEDKFAVLLDQPASGSAGKIARFMTAYRDCDSYSGSLQDWSHGSRLDFPALQAADFVAAEIFRWMRELDTNPRAIPQDKVQALIHGSYHEGLIQHSDLETFKNMAEDVRNGGWFFTISLAN
jgi:hypothetical protein